MRRLDCDHPFGGRGLSARIPVGPGGLGFDEVDARIVAQRLRQRLEFGYRLERRTRQFRRNLGASEQEAVLEIVG